ncbi:hypothetical protein LUZ60_002115 [Juncus effusus]|nr:hypothetical protein LUZ60_002115 [Juncus effusus]
MNCGQPNELPHCFLNLNWDQCIDQNGQLDPQMSSMVSQSEIPPQSHYTTNTNASIGTGTGSLSTPPELDLSMGGGGTGLIPMQYLVPMTHLDQFQPDPNFAQRAAQLSSFDERNYTNFTNQFDVSSINKGKRQEISILGGELNQLIDKSQLGVNNLNNGRDESSVSDPVGFLGPSDSNARKRKSKAKGKATLKVSEEKGQESKRCKSVESNGTQEELIKLKSEPNGSLSTGTTDTGTEKKGKETSTKQSEPLKDYIHVRARRGEATDSHSLAERVRREKISQRMKLLQDLVPGCNKVVGKAVMLDEIINYVQSLQRQVEFLSMKLATVNPQLDFNNLPSLLQKDMQQACGLGGSFPLDTSSAAFNQQQGNPLHFISSNSSPVDPHNSIHPFLNSVTDPNSQLGAYWHDDLQNVVPMDIGQNQEEIAQGFNGAMQQVHMKMEL